MTATTRTITVDQNGISCIAEVNGEEIEIDAYGQNLKQGDNVMLDDGTEWIVARVYGHIQTCNQGSGGSNYVAVDLASDSEDA